MTDEPRDEVAEALQAWQSGGTSTEDFREFVTTKVTDADMRDKLLLMLDFRQGGPPASREG